MHHVCAVPKPERTPVLMELEVQVVVGLRGDGPWKEDQINWSWRHEAALWAAHLPVTLSLWWARSEPVPGPLQSL